MAEAYYPTGNGSYTKWTPDMVGALGANFEGMSYKGCDSQTDWNTLAAGIYYIGQTSFQLIYINLWEPIHTAFF